MRDDTEETAYGFLFLLSDGYLTCFLPLVSQKFSFPAKNCIFQFFKGQKTVFLSIKIGFFNRVIDIFYDFLSDGIFTPRILKISIIEEICSEGKIRG